MSAGYSDVVNVARDYYNSSDADNFYFEIWGGKDIHIGLYDGPDDSIAAASEKTVAAMAAELGELTARSRVMDFGAGYGGSARWLARRFGCHVSCVNLSEVQNERNRSMNVAEGLDRLIEVFDASFENAPVPSGAYDVVWSQDSILHSGDRAQVFDEVDRILKPGGEFIFTDPMQADDCPKGVLQPVLDRLHLESLGSIGFYREQAARLGWTEVGITELTPQLVNHYARVREELMARRKTMTDSVSESYIDRMIKGLSHWIDAGSLGLLSWGILHFRKPR
jgi:sarcosine/dimethylglycine N-methyltransferase